MPYFDPEYNRTYTFKRYSLPSRQLAAFFDSCLSIQGDQQETYMLDVADWDEETAWTVLEIEEYDAFYIDVTEEQDMRETINAVMAEAKSALCLKSKHEVVRTYKSFDIMLGAYGFMFSQHARFLDEQKVDMETRQWWMDRLNDLYMEITGEEC